MDLICCRLHKNNTETTFIKTLSPRFLVDEILGERVRGNLTETETQFLYNFKNDDQKAVFSNETFANYTEMFWSADLTLLVNDQEAAVLRRFYKMLDENDTVLREIKMGLGNLQLATIIGDENESNWCLTSFDSISCLQIVSTFDFESPTCPDFQVILK